MEMKYEPNASKIGDYRPTRQHDRTRRPLQLLFDLAEAAGAFLGLPMRKERPVADVFNTFGWCSRNTYKSLFPNRGKNKQELKHAWSLNHPLVKGNPFKAAILETLMDLAFLSFIADVFKKK